MKLFNKTIRLTATFRGIPLYLLEESGLCQQITTLSYKWYARYDHARKQIKPKHWLMVIGCLLISLAIYLFLTGAGNSVNTKLFLTGCLFIALRVVTQPWQLARALRRLDNCLKQTNHLGLNRLPEKDAEVETFLIGEAVLRIKYILYYEKKGGCDPELAELWRQWLEELDDNNSDFGYIFDEHEPHYKRAREELSNGTDALAKKYQMLEEVPKKT